MNPYEPPNVHDERTQKPRRRNWPIVLAMFLGAILVVGGLALFAVVQVGRATAMQAKANRQKEAAERAEAQRASDAAAKLWRAQEP